METSLENTIKGCVKNNIKSQEKIFEMYYGKMMTVAMSYMKDSDSADSVIQDSFMKVFRKLSSYDSGVDLKGWIRKIVVNTAIDKLVKGNVKLVFSDTDLSKDSNEDFEFKSTPEYIIKSLQDLPDAYRIVFNLYALENMTHVEISEKLNIELKTSKSSYIKAKEILQKNMLDVEGK